MCQLCDKPGKTYKSAIQGANHFIKEEEGEYCIYLLVAKPRLYAAFNERLDALKAAMLMPRSLINQH